MTTIGALFGLFVFFLICTMLIGRRATILGVILALLFGRNSDD